MSEAPNANGSFSATFLIVVGIAWMALTGLCTAGFAVSSFFGGANDLANIISVLTFVLIVGAICIAPGLVFWLIGRALKRRRS